MAKVVAPITAIVEVIGKPRESKHQAGSYYYPTLFLDESREGDDAKIWKNLSGDEVSQIKKGDRVQLVPAGKSQSGGDKHNIVLLSSAPAAAVPTPIAASSAPDTPAPALAPAPVRPGPVPVTFTTEQKQALAQKAVQNAAFLAFCWETVCAKFENLDDQQAIAALTVALFEKSL